MEKPPLTEVRVFDLSGRLVAGALPGVSDYVQELPSGAYVVKAATATSSQTKKILVQ